MGRNGWVGGWLGEMMLRDGKTGSVPSSCVADQLCPCVASIELHFLFHISLSPFRRDCEYFYCRNYFKFSHSFPHFPCRLISWEVPPRRGEERRLRDEKEEENMVKSPLSSLNPGQPALFPQLSDIPMKAHKLTWMGRTSAPETKNNLQQKTFAGRAVATNVFKTFSI